MMYDSFNMLAFIMLLYSTDRVTKTDGIELINTELSEMLYFDNMSM